MPNEALATIATRHQLHIERLKAGEVAKFDAFLKAMDEDLREQLTRSKITDFTKSRLEKQLALIDSMIRGHLSDYEKIWRSSLVDFGKYEVDFEGRSFDSVIEASFALPQRQC